MLGCLCIDEIVLCFVFRYINMLELGFNRLVCTKSYRLIKIHHIVT